MLDVYEKPMLHWINHNKYQLHSFVLSNGTTNEYGKFHADVS